MTAKTPAQLKQLFETGDVMVQTSFEDAFDSYVNVLQTTAQTVISNLSLAAVSASSLTVTTAAAAVGNFTAVNASTVSANVVSASSVFVNRLQQSVIASINAVGSAQASAAVLTGMFNAVFLVSGGINDGVISSAHIGRSQTVFNRGTDQLKWYPQTGSAINGLGANVPCTVQASASLSLTYLTATQAYTR